MSAIKDSWLYSRFRELRRSLGMRRVRSRARQRRQRSAAIFVAVTGSSAKTTTVALLAHILSKDRKTRSQMHRNGIGMASKLLASLKPDDEFVVVECGTGRPGEIQGLASLVRPHVGIVTLVDLEHYSTFRSKEAIAQEKGQLIRSLPAQGLALINNDDPLVRSMAQTTAARIVTFGKPGADYAWGEPICREPGGLSFPLHYREQSIVLETRLTGIHNRLAVTAAVACAFELGIPAATIIERTRSFDAVFGRLSVHKVAGGPTIILDTCKAPLHSLQLSFGVLADSSARRKRLVLGDISDYRGAAKPKYRDAYRAGLAVADEVIFVGTSARRYRAPADEIAQGRFKAFDSVELAAKYLQSTATDDEVLLVKSGRSFHLERLLLAWQTQVRCWPDACGVAASCLECGLFGEPFDTHRLRHSKRRPGRTKLPKSADGRHRGRGSIEA